MKELVDKNKFADSLIHCHGLGRKSLQLVLECLEEQELEIIPSNGEWIKVFVQHEFFPSKRVISGFECSECGYGIDWTKVVKNYCPNCGSKNQVNEEIHKYEGEVE